jgi:hypothetical protein
VSEKVGREELRAEVERGHLVRAAQMAESIGLPREEIQDIRTRALWDMAALNRNAPGTKRLAQEYGLSKEGLRELLERYAEERRREGDSKPLEPCFDIGTGEYLTFGEWLNAFLRKYDNLPVS